MLGTEQMESHSQNLLGFEQYIRWEVAEVSDWAVK